jgi:hypothetical protein
MRDAVEILGDIERFEPANGLWLPLDALLQELWQAGVKSDHLPVLFRVFERFPQDDGAGVLWSIVHGVERHSTEYEAPLRESMRRVQSEMGEVMLQRLERSRAV